jgi:hypothetical protein
MENHLHTSNAGQGMGTAALVLGILTILIAFIPCVGLVSVIFGILAIIFGIIGYMKAKKGNASTSMPIAGMILGVVGTIFALMWVLLFVGTVWAGSLADENEMNTTLDSIHTETTKMQDSLNNSVEVMNDSLEVEESKE